MHTRLHRKKLLDRVHRIQGQVGAIEKMLRDDPDACERLMSTIAATRGGLNALMVEVLDGHISHHVIDPKRKPTALQREATEQLMDVIRSYLR